MDFIIGSLNLLLLHIVLFLDLVIIHLINLALYFIVIVKKNKFLS